MDFPDKSFPYQLYKPSKKREVFLSYGSHDNIDVDNITEKQFYPQKIPEGFLNKKISLKPCRPTLPLHEEPQIVEYPLKDRVTDPVTDERKEIVSLIHNLKYNRGIVKVKPGNTSRKSANFKCFNGLKSRLEQFNVEDENRDDIMVNDFLPKQFHHLVHLYHKYKDITEIQVYCFIILFKEKRFSPSIYYKCVHLLIVIAMVSPIMEIYSFFIN
ncbi:Hypothetical predicted protein [Mytilus galloprovincialis]|uniref:Uncharacterized protein n=1 Tax=Mytilus galloprovincialis TaxID=29158 RepID=A0A8B6FZM3_MYTGA|nr:Hypothetical predicted protein [Mytilus galloprovincialis]